MLSLYCVLCAAVTAAVAGPCGATLLCSDGGMYGGTEGRQEGREGGRREVVGRKGARFASQPQDLKGRL